MSQKIQLVITQDENGTIGVAGPINNKVLCYGMLAVAHDAIKDFNDQAAKQRPLDLVTGLPDSSKDRSLSFNAPLSRG